MSYEEQTRRSFLVRSVLASAGLGLASRICKGADAPQTFISAASLKPGEKLRIGILGCGNRSQAHIQAVNHLAEHMEVAALCDILPEKLEEKKKMVKSGEPRLYTDSTKMLKEADVHAVVVVLPNTLHREGTIASLEAGKHVLCEKPLTLKVADTKAIIDASGRTQRIVQVGTQSRHSPGYAALAQKLREGLIGPVLYGVAQTFRADWVKLYPDPEEDSQKNWRMRQDEGGSVVYEMGIHTIDVFNWFIGDEPVEITCLGGVHNRKLQNRDSWDHAGIVVRYANGALMTYGGNLYSCGGPGPDILFGENATLQLGSRGAGEAIVRKCAYWRPYGKGTGPDKMEAIKLPTSKTDPSTLQYLHFLDAVQGKKPAFPSARDHLPAVLIAQAAQMSLAERRHIKASEVT
ncbi:MAG: Gfo/Idh/MocA family oxidoreductase [Phycisphaerae bacterium]|nr:Gfo/Idh/MocA family oxidoreductase [Phycisphaerae bacterium]